MNDDEEMQGGESTAAKAGAKHEDICVITTFPKASEVFSKEKTYLPLSNPHTWHLPGMRGLIDRQFRLLREENLYFPRMAIRAEFFHLRELNLRDLQQRDKGEFNYGNLKKHAGRYNAYLDASFTRYLFNEHKGLELEVRFSQLPFLKDVDAGGRKRWWQSTKRFEEGNLVYLIYEDEDTIKHILHCECSYSQKLRGNYRNLFSDSEYAYVRLRLTSTMNHNLFNHLMTAWIVDTSRSSFTLLDFPGTKVHSFEPALKTFRHMSKWPTIPFDTLLAPRDPDQPGILESTIPEYATRPGFRFDLRSVTQKGDFFLSLHEPFDMKTFKDVTYLDETQAEAVVNSIQNKVALIQGPPGTGKTFCGVSITRILLDSMPEDCKSPILCVSTTNKALDHFLESLHHAGVYGIVRVGYRSESEILRPLNLNARVTKSPEDKNKLAALYDQSTKRGEMIRLLLQKLYISEALEIPGQALEGAEKPDMVNLLSTDEKPELEKLLSTHEKLRNAKDNIDLACHYDVLSQARVIGLTINGLSMRRKLLERVGPKILICEEAGATLEAHQLTTFLPSIQQAVLIGDHLQLFPQVDNYNLDRMHRHGKKYAFNVSLFERLAESKAEVQLTTLQAQRRMHPSISKLIRNTLYPALQDTGPVFTYPEVRGMKRRLFWLDHSEIASSFEDVPEMEDGTGNSLKNDFEASVAVALTTHLLRQDTYMDKKIAIITPYNAQKVEIGYRLSHLPRTVPKPKKQFEPIVNCLKPNVKLLFDTTGKDDNLLDEVRLTSVDEFQGQEADIIIVSLSRSNNENKTGFLRVANRINVLLSRAKHGMYIIGNATTFSKVPMWRQVLAILREAGNIGPVFELLCPRHSEASPLVRLPEEFHAYSPEGGCTKNCDIPLSCGHPCTGKCHSKLLHDIVVCTQPCARKLLGCSHPCPEPCNRPCSRKCQVLVDVENDFLPCGHTAPPMLPCWLNQRQELVHCQEPMTFMVPHCNHWVTAPCGTDTTSPYFNCTSKCNQRLPCGHTCPGDCGSCTLRIDGRIIDRTHQPCVERCEHILSCGHQCPGTCGECRKVFDGCIVSIMHPVCKATCDAPLACGHLCKAACGSCSLTRHSRCDEPCERIVARCGHVCGLRCHFGEPCLTFSPPGEDDAGIEGVCFNCCHVDMINECIEDSDGRSVPQSPINGSAALPASHLPLCLKHDAMADSKLTGTDRMEGSDGSTAAPSTAADSPSAVPEFCFPLRPQHRIKTGSEL